MASLTIRIRRQLDDFARSEVDSQSDKIKLDVRTARIDLRCFASPGVDQKRVVTVLEDCSSPIEKSSKEAGSWIGHSSTVKIFTRKCT